MVVHSRIAGLQPLNDAVFVKELGGQPQVTLIIGGKSSELNAALVNGAASHIVELDDINKVSIIHAATVVVPAVLAVVNGSALQNRLCIL